jgi:hypothetical protein
MKPLLLLCNICSQVICFCIEKIVSWSINYFKVQVGVLLLGFLYFSWKYRSIKVKKAKVKVSLYEIVEAHRVVRC